MARARRMMTRLDAGPGRPPLPPPGIPPGYILPLEGRGETFVRSHEGPADAPVLLLLHGWTASADLQWCTVYEVLCERYSVIAIDHRGHGRGIRSEEEFTLEACADDAAAAVRLLVPGRTVIAVGYSMGGPIALQLWHRHRDLVAGIVLEATALEWKSALEDRLRWRFLVLLDRMLRSRRHASMDRALPARGSAREPRARAIRAVDPRRDAPQRSQRDRRGRACAARVRRPAVRTRHGRPRGHGDHDQRPRRAPEEAASTREGGAGQGVRDPCRSRRDDRGRPTVRGAHPARPSTSLQTRARARRQPAGLLEPSRSIAVLS